MSKITAKHVVQFLTALLLAWGASRFVEHFHLLEFWGAPALTFLFLFAGYWLLSRKYEPVLHAIFLGMAIVVFYKSLHLSKLTQSLSSEETILNRLYIAAALLKNDVIESNATTSIEKKHWQDFFADDKYLIESCATDCSWQTPAPSGSPQSFWIRLTTKKSRDKKTVLWYINDTFEVYRKSETETDFKKISSDNV